MDIRGAYGHSEDDVLLSEWPDINEGDVNFASNER